MNKTIAIIGILVLAACSNSEPAAASSKTASAPAAAAPAGAGQISGTVAETFNGGGYTYLRVTTPSGDVWAAVPETTIATGAPVTLNVQMTMEQFESKSLNRKFDQLAFATLAGAATGAPAAQAGGMGAATHMASPDAGTISVEKAPGGLTVAEVWAQKNALSGKEVVVRGQVVKYLGDIMGTNWMHVQDGSGSREKGDHDLTVTTSASAKPGDVVTVKGTLTLDKDFGSGYRYAVIVENATVTK